MYWAKYFPGKGFELLLTLRTQITSTCNKLVFLEKIKFWPVTLQESTLSNVFKFCVCICLHCSNLLLVQFHKWKRWTRHWLHNTESLFSDNQWICQPTNRKIYFLTTELKVIMASWRIKQKIVFLPKLMTFCCHQTTKHSFLMTQA